MGVWEDVVLNAKTAVNAVGKKAGEMVDISKLRLSATEITREISNQFEEIGRMVYEAKKEEKPKGIATFDEITFEDFSKIELRVGKILDCEPVKKSKKLLKLTVNDGEKERTVVSGISQWYQSDDLIGHHIILVANLKPAKLCGVESQGMILAADCDENTVKVIFVDDMPAGSGIH